MDPRTAATDITDGVPHEHVEVATAKPYVVSLDIVPLLTRWALVKKFSMPNPDFFGMLRKNMHAELGTIFPVVEIVEEGDIRSAILRMTSSLGLPVISLDYAYCPIGVPLNVTRAVHTDMTDAGVTHRGKSFSIEKQVRDIASQLQGDVALVDDVIFSGEMTTRDVIPMLRRHGITVRTVVAGVGIRKGVRRIQAEGVDVLCVREYAEVEDEICERDFYPGSPLCGRTVLGTENVGMPYIRPFGNAQDWASIPGTHVDSFSRFCLGQSIELFTEIENISGKTVRMRDLDRGIYSLPTGDQRFVDELSKACDSF